VVPLPLSLGSRCAIGGVAAAMADRLTVGWPKRPARSGLWRVAVQGELGERRRQVDEIGRLAPQTRSSLKSTRPVSTQLGYSALAPGTALPAPFASLPKAGLSALRRGKAAIHSWGFRLPIR